MDKRPSRIISELLARPDQLALEMGAEGELLVARVRAIGCAVCKCGRRRIRASGIRYDGWEKA